MLKPTDFTDEMINYATPRQWELILKWKEVGSSRKAGEALGVSGQAITQAARVVHRKAAVHGVAPAYDMTTEVPEPFLIKGTSTLYDKDGIQKLQWVKTKIDDQQWAKAVEEFAISLGDHCLGQSLNPPAPEEVTDTLLAVYPMGDPHFGMYAWAEETGSDFDTVIAERELIQAMSSLVDRAPNCDTAIVLNLGDFFHADNDSKVTGRSGNILDVDTRHAQVMQVGARAMVTAIELAARKHKRVVVRNVMGNHDDHSSYALALILDAYFRNNPRVDVQLSANMFWYFHFGNNLIGSTHGHTCKIDKLPAIMAFDQPEAWGVTQNRYWYTGHVHHESVKDFPGVRCESFRTLAPTDAWARAAGYRSAQDMHCIILHKKYGEVGRNRVNIAYVKDHI